jgi:hypothetical protein
MKNFRITNNKGFQITLDNGWTVSVQWGRYDYGDHYDATDDEVDCTESDQAEIGVFRDGPGKSKLWWKTEQAESLGFFSGVAGYESPNKVAEVIAIVSNL